MQNCAACSAPLRDGARFCTQCGVEVRVASPVASAPVAPPASPDTDEIRVDDSEPIPARIPPQRRGARIAVRSTAATWALVSGVAPLVLSVVGNLVSSQLGVAALVQVESGNPQGAWAPVLTVLALVFVGNAALLTVCAITGTRAIRETANGITRGRGLAVAGLAAGGVNLVLWLVGIVVTVSQLNIVLA